MKKSILFIAITAIVITSCQKEKIQSVELKQKTYLQVQAIDYDGNVSGSTNVITVK